MATDVVLQNKRKNQQTLIYFLLRDEIWIFETESFLSCRKNRIKNSVRETELDDVKTGNDAAV